MSLKYYGSHLPNPNLLVVKTDFTEGRSSPVPLLMVRLAIFYFDRILNRLRATAHVNHRIATNGRLVRGLRLSNTKCDDATLAIAALRLSLSVTS